MLDDKDIGTASTLEDICPHCHVARNDHNGLCLNLCLLPPDAWFEHEDKDKTPRRPWEIALNVAVERSLRRQPGACPECFGPVEFVDGRRYCVLKRSGRCPPPNKETRK